MIKLYGQQPQAVGDLMKETYCQLQQQHLAENLKKRHFNVKIKTLQQQDQQNKKTNNMFIVHVHRID
jgi:hypothetical protein